MQLLEQKFKDRQGKVTRHFLMFAAESEEESQLLDLIDKQAVGAIHSATVSLHLSDGYGEHYMRLDLVADKST